MKNSAFSLETIVTTVYGIVLRLFQLGVALGASCVFVYCMHIGYLPQEISLGDSLLLLFPAIFFAGIHIFFISFMTSLGTIIVHILKLIIFKFCKWFGFDFRLCQKKIDEIIAPFSFLTLIMAFFAVLLIYLFGEQNKMAYGSLLLLSVMLFTVYSIFKYMNKKIKIVEVMYTMADLLKIDTSQYSKEIKEHKLINCILIFLMVFLPLVLSGISDQLLYSAMRMAKIRVENVIIYVKQPYDALFPSDLCIDNIHKLDGYTSYEKVSILFRGFGDKTVISFKEGEGQQQLEIPNDHIFVVEKITY